MVETTDVGQLKSAARAVLERAPRPRVGVVLGSGLGGFTEGIEDPVQVGYRDIPGMPVPGVAGHAGRLVLGGVGGVPVACLSGRVHAYEGHAPGDVVFGVRLLAELGCDAVLLTNAAGGINPSFATGSLMLITDHLNLTGRNPLVGPNQSAWGARFPDMTDAYDATLRSLALEAAAEESLPLHEGVYAGVLGPSYETPAEIRMLKRLGADAVGMSTVFEVVALRHRGVRVGAVSCITNAAAGTGNQPLSHDDVQRAAAESRDQLERLIVRWCRKVGAFVG